MHAAQAAVAFVRVRARSHATAAIAGGSGSVAAAVAVAALVLAAPALADGGSPVSPSQPDQSAAPSPQQDLASQLAPAADATNTALWLETSSYPWTFDASEAGAVSVRWYAAASSHRGGDAQPASPVLVASGQARFTHAGHRVVAVRATPAGRALLRAQAAVTLDVEGEFQPDGQPSVTVDRQVKLGTTAFAAGTSAAPSALSEGLSCPDPSVVDAHTGGYRYYLACTSDYEPNAFPIRGSNDLRHWHPIAYAFPAGHQPWWALHSPQGRYWAPALYRIGNRWVLYFAAQVDLTRMPLHTDHGEPTGSGTFVVGVASAASLTGPWQTRILHYRGQFNDVAGVEQEHYGGVIDPSMVQDPVTGQRYLFWAEQHSSVWVAKLSSDGLHLDRHIHLAMWTQSGSWECAGGCTVEGPEEFYRDGWFYLFYSGASTWYGTYAVGVAASHDPLHGTFVRLSPQPILASGRHWAGPGGCSHPVAGPSGRTYLLYHATQGSDPGHVSEARYLQLSALTWGGVGGYYPLLGSDGRAG